MSLAHHDKPGTQHPLAERRLPRRLQADKHRDHRHTCFLFDEIVPDCWF